MSGENITDVKKKLYEKKEIHVANMLRRALDGNIEVRDVFTLCRFRLNNLLNTTMEKHI
jgi:hypothetical protein